MAKNSQTPRPYYISGLQPVSSAAMKLLTRSLAEALETQHVPNWTHPVSIFQDFLTWGLNAPFIPSTHPSIYPSIHSSFFPPSLSPSLPSFLLSITLSPTHPPIYSSIQPPICLLFLIATTVMITACVYGGLGLPRWLIGKESACQCRNHRRPKFDPWVRKIPCRRKWQPTPGFLPGESQRQRSLEGYSP